jgi:hypothetical protein
MLRLTASFTVFILLCGLTGAASEISVSQSLDRSQIAFEDSLRFQITLKWDGPQAAYLFDKPLTPDLNRLSVRSFTSTVKTGGEGTLPTTTKTYDYVLAPTAGGLGSIEPITIQYLAWPDSIPGSLVTEAMTVRIAEPRPPAADSGSPLIWLVPVAVLLVAAGGLTFMVRSRRARQEQVPVMTPSERFLEELGTLKSETGDDYKRFLSGLCPLIEEYFSARFGIAAAGLDDAALAEALATAPISVDDAERLASWYCGARKDKFRPVKATPGATIRLEAEIRELMEKIRESE